MLLQIIRRSNKKSEGKGTQNILIHLGLWTEFLMYILAYLDCTMHNEINLNFCNAPKNT